MQQQQQGQIRMNVIAPEDDGDAVSHIWRSCCLEIDKRATLFFTQLGLTLILLCLCIIELVKQKNSCEDSAPYLALLATLIAYWLPQPTLH